MHTCQVCILLRLSSLIGDILLPSFPSFSLILSVLSKAPPKEDFSKPGKRSQRHGFQFVLPRGLLSSPFYIPEDTEGRQAIRQGK